jgi:dihydroorotate dehydrogenase
LPRNYVTLLQASFLQPEKKDMRTFADKDEALKFVTDELYWGGAAGTCKDPVTARKYGQAGMTVVPYGSMTFLDRSGNAGDNFYYDASTGNAINAWGIPNKGYKAYIPEMIEVKKEVNAHGALLSASISAGDKFDPNEYGRMAKDISDQDAADIIEGNMSCGNMKVGDVYKPVVCYDLDAFDAGVFTMCKGAGNKKKAIKITPTTERRFLFGNLESCLKYGVDYLIVANTIPNSYIEKPDGTPGITMVRGGLSGHAMRPIITGMLQMLAPAVEGTKLKIVAAGGVDDGLSAYNYLKHRAHGFVFSAHLWNNNFNPECAQQIIFGKEDSPTPVPGLLDLLVERGLPN